MKINKMYGAFICIWLTMFQTHAHKVSPEYLDVMVEFAYPVSEIEALRHEIAQGLCFLRQAVTTHGSQEFLRAFQALEQADALQQTRAHMSNDDRDVLQNLLDQINALISSLEEHDMRASLSAVHDRLQDKLY